MMNVNDLCRCCKKNLRTHGVLTNTIIIFERNSKGECIYEQVLRLGLELNNTANKSYRICRSCQNLITRLERDMPVFKKWTCNEEYQDEEACSSEASEKRNREPTPSKTPRALKNFSPNPSNPTGTRTQRSITEQDLKAGCAAEKLKEGGSIPTLRNPSVNSEPGTADSSCRILPPVRHVASQTDPPKIKSVGTQLSMQTLRNQFQSKATQVKMPGRDCGVCTDTFPLDSPLLLLQPTLVKRPSKRPRLSLTDKEEGPSESSSFVVVHEPEDST